MPKKRVGERNTIELPKTFKPRFWSDCDGRTGMRREIMRRFRQLKADTGADSYPLEILAMRAIFITIQLETMERKAAETEEFDQGVYTQMVNALSGLLVKLGLAKKKKAGDDALQIHIGKRHRA